MILSDAWKSEAGSVQDFCDKPGEGFFVPLYQREYTWEEENITQLCDDLVLGIRELVGNTGDKSITFLGTAICSLLTDTTHTVATGQDKATPTAVQVVIDGQQRISTIALFAIVLRARLASLIKHLPSVSPYDILINHQTDLAEDLEKIYAVKLGRGAYPSHKPKIIRAKEDKWAFQGADTSYTSPVALYIATYIRTDVASAALAAIDGMAARRVRGNIELINDTLDNICQAHVPDTDLHDQFPVGSVIATDRIQRHVLGFADAALRKIIEKTETDKDAKSKDYFATAIYQVFLLAHYLLRRCGLNRLQARRQEWGFDMFQSHNATGTPLTAMETFRPQVIAAEGAYDRDWETTPSAQYMDEIDTLFKDTTSNQKKTHRTNELLRTFALCHSGDKLGNKFSAQRLWMTNQYESECSNIQEKRQFLSNLGKVAKYYRYAWYMEDIDTQYYINGLKNHHEGKLASFLVQYLKDANSQLSAAILTRFYDQAVADPTYLDDFVEAVKACAAFFTLWRSARSTSGLDNIYRRFFKGSNRPIRVGSHTWRYHPGQVLASDLKGYFADVLKKQKIDQEKAWLRASKRFLVYTGVRKVCRFVLFVGGHERVKDPNRPGLTTVGNSGFCSLLNLEKWQAKEFKTLEHIAPQRPARGHKWDKRIYVGDTVDEVGNLLPLPTDVNRYADNKDWGIKFLYYSQVGERNSNRIKQLEADATRHGYYLRKRATSALRAAKYNCVVEPVLSVGFNGKWNKKMIDQRTKQIKEIAWATLAAWLKV